MLTKNQLKETMLGLTCKPDSIEFENGLLISLYITNFDHIANLQVKKIIIQNKENLKKALENTHPEVFDIRDEYKFGIIELEKLLDRMPEPPSRVSKGSDMAAGCSQSVGESSDKASTIHGDTKSRSRFGSAADSERGFHQL
jgi:hypothetical protein